MTDPVLAIALAFIAASPGIFLAYRQTRKDVSEEGREIAKTALTLIQPYKDRVSELEQKLKIVEPKLEALEAAIKTITEKYNIVLDGAHRLYHQVESLNGHPVWKPPEKNPTEPKAGVS